MCFHHPIAKIIIKEQGVDALVPTNCFGRPCIAIKETGEHLHNNYPNLGLMVDMDVLDHEMLCKLQGKLN